MGTDPIFRLQLKWKCFRAEVFALPAVDMLTAMKNWMLIAIEIVMPGGSLIALALFLYRRFAQRAA